MKFKHIDAQLKLSRKTLKIKHSNGTCWNIYTYNSPAYIFLKVQLKTKFDYIPGIKSRHIASTKSICVRDRQTLSKIIKSYSRHPKTSVSIIKRKPEMFTVQIFSSYIRKLKQGKKMLRHKAIKKQMLDFA